MLCNPKITMKKILSLLALTSAFALMPVNSTNAHDFGRVVGYTPCGKPIIATHEVVGRDHCGRNIWEWVTHYPSSCHCGDRRRADDQCSSSRHHYEAPRRESSWSFFFRF